MFPLKNLARTGLINEYITANRVVNSMSQVIIQVKSCSRRSYSNHNHHIPHPCYVSSQRIHFGFMKIIQSSTVIARSYIIWFCIRYYIDWGKIYIRGYIFTKTPHTSPLRTSYGVSYVRIGVKIWPRYNGIALYYQTRCYPASRESNIALSSARYQKWPPVIYQWKWFQYDIIQDESFLNAMLLLL